MKPVVSKSKFILYCLCAKLMFSVVWYFVSNMHVLLLLRAWWSHWNTQIWSKFILWIGRHNKKFSSLSKKFFFVCEQTANVFLKSRGKSKSYHFLIVSSITRWTVLFSLILAHFTFHSVNNITKTLNCWKINP